MRAPKNWGYCLRNDTTGDLYMQTFSTQRDLCCSNVVNLTVRWWSWAWGGPAERKGVGMDKKLQAKGFSIVVVDVFERPPAKPLVGVSAVSEGFKRPRPAMKLSNARRHPGEPDKGKK